ncbi:MAG: ribosome small subunit-dependent GTPase A [Clostridiales bacterium]|nr:ribosome small subunit-dependent GTPase A [Clostridiales bacterium]
MGNNISNSIKGIITKGVGGTYTVRASDGDLLLCQIRGGLRGKKITPAIGDMVTVSPSGDPDIPYVLEKIGKRKNDLVRPPLSNVDMLILVFAVKDPEPDLKLLDKMLIVCGVKDIVPVIVFTKADLDPVNAKKLFDIYSRCGYRVFCSSADNKPHIEDLVGDTASEGGIIAFAGPSGVGKSTLCNHIIGTEVMLIGDISSRLGRGKHTTRHVELFDYKGYLITDTPGFTSLDLFELGITHDMVADGYPEIREKSRNCRFSDCRHIAERDCAVRDDPDMDPGRYERYKEFFVQLYESRFDYSKRK